LGSSTYVEQLGDEIRKQSDKHYKFHNDIGSSPTG
jgi:hypothetical protein